MQDGVYNTIFSGGGHCTVGCCPFLITYFDTNVMVSLTYDEVSKYSTCKLRPKCKSVINFNPKVQCIENAIKS